MKLFHRHKFVGRLDAIHGINAYYTATCRDCGHSREALRFNEFCRGPGRCEGQLPGCARCERLLINGPPPPPTDCQWCGQPESTSPPCCISRRNAHARVREPLRTN